MRHGAALRASDRALSQVLQEQPDLRRDAACERGDAMGELVRRAQAAGALRADARWEDLPMVLCTLGQVAGPPGASWERMLAIVLDGLRAPGRAALPSG